jgi:NTP pyrophosphatase (non-canonical NTP hydrolase)
MDDSLSQLTDLVLKFRADRDWAQFHTPKELAVSLVVESAELLELFQWKQGEELDRAMQRHREKIADELADVLHSLLLLAHEMKIDLPAAFKSKLHKVGQKYPVEKARGKPRKYDELE